MLDFYYSLGCDWRVLFISNPNKSGFLPDSWFWFLIQCFDATSWDQPHRDMPVRKIWETAILAFIFYSRWRVIKIAMDWLLYLLFLIRLIIWWGITIPLGFEVQINSIFFLKPLPVMLIIADNLFFGADFTELARYFTFIKRFEMLIYSRWV